MRIGLMGNCAYSVAASGPFDVEELIGDVRWAQEDGLASYWLGQQMDWDAIALAVAIGREVPEIELGTAVSVIWTTFPVHMAQSAASAQMLTGGRFTLGLGVEHDWVVREMWGLPFDRPRAVMEEYVQIVGSLLRTGTVDFTGEHYKVKTGFIRFAPQPTTQIILGALGKRMLTVAGTYADGTTTWLTGVKTIRDHIVPTIRGAAAQARRADPRVIALLPILVTADAQAARQRISAEMDLYHHMPSYRAMLDLEGVSTAGDIALVGSRAEVEDAIGELAAAGATDLGAIVIGDHDEVARTRELLAHLAAG